MSKTFYLWDLGDTLFPEKWDQEKSGFESYEKYVESLGFDLKTISPRDWQRSYERPYREEFMSLEIPQGFKEILTWTQNNAVFTTGNREQIDWRAEQIQRKYGFDIRDYIKEIHSTFDYGNTDLKTPEMLQDILQEKAGQGFSAVVYADDREQNCRFFLDAVKKLLLKARVYHLRNDDSGPVKASENYFEIGNLLQLLKNEKMVK